MKDYYATLGVSRQASINDIRKAFWGISREHHPDVAKDKATSEEKFKEANEANAILSDPERRREYDEALSKALITDLPSSVAQVVGEYFRQFHPENTK